MDGYGQRLKELAQRYKYVLVVILAGVLLMLIPTDADKTETPVAGVEFTQPGIDQRLEIILSQMEGIGKVRVMLTVSRGEQTVYIQDEDGSTSGDSQTSRREAVLITGQDRIQAGLVSHVIGPVYQGAVVVCEGGDEPGIRLQVVEAVCDATGLTADKVTVLKMK